MSTEDQLAIQEMIARYSYAYDGGEAEAFAGVFSDDGVFEVFVPGQAAPTLRLTSSAVICEWAGQRLRTRAGRFSSRHYQSGTIFDELSGNSARTRTMVLVTHQIEGDATPRPVHTGVYHDRWRKTPTGWRLAHRAARLDQEFAPRNSGSSGDNVRVQGVDRTMPGRLE